MPDSSEEKDEGEESPGMKAATEYLRRRAERAKGITNPLLSPAKVTAADSDRVTLPGGRVHR